MFTDLKQDSAPTDIRTDLCIIGAGAAGISLALELSESPLNVCVLESGDFDYDAATQSLADGDNVGLPYYELDASRLRFFGGTTNHWGGINCPLDELDFEERAYLPNSGWPIDRAMLDEYYERAHEYCRLGTYNYDPRFWATREAPLLPIGGRLATTIKLENPVRFGSEYRQRIGAAQNVRAILSANVTSFEAAENGARIASVHARSLNGRHLKISATNFVLATGAIENARLLLSSTGVHANGIGNDHDLAGRYFMEHPIVPTMELQLASADTNLSLYTGQARGDLGITAYLAPTPETLRQEGLLNACASLNIGSVDQRIAKSRKGIASAVKMWNALREGDAPPNLGTHVANLLSDMHQVAIYSYERAFKRSPLIASLVVQLEQAPDPESRVTLNHERDSLGMQKVNLDWRMGDLERDSVRRFGELIGSEIGRAGLGRIRLLEPDEDGWWDGMRGAAHQMGTTRMHAQPSKGVVDADCRVHGIGNLYIAGSSVFPTCGVANPTITIVALAIRLADHLKRLVP